MVNVPPFIVKMPPAHDRDGLHDGWIVVDDAYAVEGQALEAEGDREGRSIAGEHDATDAAAGVRDAGDAVLKNARLEPDGTEFGNQLDGVVQSEVVPTQVSAATPAGDRQMTASKAAPRRFVGTGRLGRIVARASRLERWSPDFMPAFSPAGFSRANDYRLDQRSKQQKCLRSSALAAAKGGTLPGASADTLPRRGIPDMAESACDRPVTSPLPEASCGRVWLRPHLYQWL